MRRLVLPLLVALVLGGSAQAAAVSFDLLGQFPHPDSPSSHAYAVSADGGVVVGESRMADDYSFAPFRWTAAEGMVDFAGVPPGGAGKARDVSADGSLVVGSIWDGVGVTEAFRWTEQDGVVILPSPPGWELYRKEATAVSADGSVVVGESESYPERLFRWTEAEGIVDLGPQFSGHVLDDPHISADGSVIVANDGEQGAFRWTEATGRVYLDPLPGASGPPLAYDVSADGSVIVGSIEYDSAPEYVDQAFRWTEEEGIVLLFGTPGEFYSGARAVSADGSVVVGGSSSFDYDGFAFIWDATHGARSLERVLEDEYGLNVGDFLLGWPMDISADGRVIVGRGQHMRGSPGYGPEAWRAVIPEPSTSVLLITGLLAVLLFVASRKRNDSNTFSILASLWKGDDRMLHNLWKHLTGAPRSGGRDPLRYHRPTRFALECLEDRRLLSATEFSIQPYVQAPADASMMIMWETEEECTDNEVMYRVAGSGDEFASATEDLNPDDRIAEIELTGLSPATTYEYRVRSKASGYDDGYNPSAVAEETFATYTFTTFPSTTPEKFRFAVYGDNRTHPDDHAAVMTGIIQSQPELVLHVGDLVHHGQTRNQWNPQFFAPAHNLTFNTPMFPAMGNHEYGPFGKKCNSGLLE